MSYFGNEIQRDMWEVFREVRGAVYCSELNVPPSIEFIESLEMSSIHILGLGETFDMTVMDSMSLNVSFVWTLMFSRECPSFCCEIPLGSSFNIDFGNSHR